MLAAPTRIVVNQGVRAKITVRARIVTIALPRTAVFSSTKPKPKPKSYLVMKPIIPFALLGALLAIGAADAAATKPVGYTSATIFGAFGPGNPKNNVVAPDLQNPASWAGTVASVSGDVVTLTSAALTPAAYNPVPFSFTSYSYFIETADGYWAHIVSNNATSVTLEAGAGVNFSNGEAVTIYRHLTISDVFGAANETGLLADSSGDTAVADNIVLIDELGAGNLTVIASDALAGVWITDAFEDAAALPIYPDQGIQVVRRGLTNLTLVLDGEVDTNGRQIGVTTGVQIRPQVIPVPTTLTDLDLYTGSPATGVVGSATGDTAEADIVTVVVNGTSTNYFYAEVDLGGGVGWYDDGLAFAGATALPSGAGLVINRSNPTNSSPFVWINPAPTIAP
jgi:hypothetical protein